MTRACLLAMAMVLLLVPSEAGAQVLVNMSETFCGGACTEGHDNTTCVCEQREGAWLLSTDPEDYLDCYEANCCEAAVQWNVDYDTYLATFDIYEAFAMGSEYYAQFYWVSTVDSMRWVSNGPGSNVTFQQETGVDWAITRYYMGAAIFGFKATACTRAEQTPWDDGSIFRFYHYVSD